MEALISLIINYLESIITYIVADLVTWKERAIVFKDLAIGISALYAITIGAKKLKILLDEDLKQRISDMRSSNKDTHEFAVRIIEELEAEILVENFTGPINEDELNWLREVSLELGKKSLNANTTAQTLIFLLKRVLVDLKPFYKTKGFTQITVKADIYRFFHLVLVEVMNDTRSVFELPEVYKTKGESKTRYEYSFGINLKPNSQTVLKFYDFTQRANSSSEYLARSLLSTIGSNYPVFKLMDKYRIYIPPLVAIPDDTQKCFQHPPLQLIRLNLKKIKYLFFDLYKVESAVYSPLSNNVGYIYTQDSIEKYKDHFYDFIFDKKLPPNFFSSTQIKGQQLIKVKFSDYGGSFLWGYKRLTLHNWIKKKIYTDDL